MNKDKDLMLLNIQLFADEADNDSDVDLEFDPIEDDTEIADGEVEFDEPIDKTKAFATRLREKTEEIEKQAAKTIANEKDNIARLQGYTNWDAYQKAVEDNRMSEFGVEDPEQFKTFINDIVNNNPEVLKAKQILAERSETEQQKALDAEVEIVKGYDETIKSLDDLVNSSNYDKILEKVKQGYKLSDAYLICNLDTINVEQINKAKQDGAQNVQSKSHMKRAGGAGGDSITVPEDVAAIYRKTFPDWDEEKIKQDYKKQMKGGK